MRILLINRKHYIDGGADRVYLNTGKLLETNGHDVAYFSTLNENNLVSKQSEYFVSSIKTRHNDLYSKITSVKKYLYNNEAALKILKVVNDFKPDVVHIHLFYGVFSGSILEILRKSNIPIVITVHDYRLLCPANAMLDKSGIICEKCKDDKFYNCILKRCSEGNIFQSTIIATEAYLRKFVLDPLVLVNHFIFVSEFSKNKHIAFDERYINKSSHLYNFATFSDSDLESNKGDYLFYYGRLSKEKGIINLINAVKETKSKLKIAGDGPLKDQVLEAIKGCLNIEYVGFKSGSDLNNLIINSSFIVVPSEWYENNPMTIVESFSFGKPVISSKIGGIPELVNDETGYIFNAANMASLVNAIKLSEGLTADRYNLISHNCYTFARKYFSKRSHMDQLLNIYKKVINENAQCYKQSI
jgi:glycosyltransferase involved in cell wall biosynthesis